MLWQSGEHRTNDVRDCVADDDPKGTHAPEGKGELKERYGCATAGAKAMVHDVDVSVPPA